MIATLQGYGQYWLPSGTPLLATVKEVPFAVPVAVCSCHWRTWRTSERTGLLVIVPWDA